ncbi:MAG: hypothetical protein DI529_01415 [Chryseobacterium sp.]|nr:MAG: hypothetical protein DI529_01415 [Chryseobacterium sp.]
MTYSYYHLSTIIYPLKEGTNLNIAPMGTASFFVFFRFLSLFGMTKRLKNKKDIVDSGLECSNKCTTVLLLIKRIIILEK